MTGRLGLAAAERAAARPARLGSVMADELARFLMPVAEGIVEPLRGFGAYAPLADREALGRPTGDAAVLLCYFGRRPDWAA